MTSVCPSPSRSATAGDEYQPVWQKRAAAALPFQDGRVDRLREKLGRGTDGDAGQESQTSQAHGSRSLQ